MPLKKIFFIVNPVSGSGRQLQEINKALIHSSFPHDRFEVHIAFTRKRGDTEVFVKEAIDRGCRIIVACGGDGTINEVARHLVHTDITLAIIPRGSGNGLASHLRIPKDLRSCFKIIREGRVIAIDSGLAGDMRFFSNCGMGFPAEVIREYDLIPQRKLPGYIKASIASLRSISHSETLKVEVGDLHFLTRHLFVSNSNRMGYNMTLSPAASLCDGKLDIVVIPAGTFAGFSVFASLALLRIGHLAPGVTTLNSSGLLVTGNGPTLSLQVDGEYFETDRSQIEIKIQPASLNILVAPQIHIP